MFIQIILGIFAASFIEWTVHKHILHELGKRKYQYFRFIGVNIMRRQGVMAL